MWRKFTPNYPSISDYRLNKQNKRILLKFKELIKLFVSIKRKITLERIFGVYSVWEFQNMFLSMKTERNLTLLETITGDIIRVATRGVLGLMKGFTF